MKIPEKENNQILLEKQLTVDQKWLLETTSAYFGINQRVRNLFLEMHNSPFKADKVHVQLREIALNDLWFYQANCQIGRAFSIILSLFDSLLQKDMDRLNKERILNTFFEFIRELFQTIIDEDELESLLLKILSTLENSLLKDPVNSMYSSSLLKKIPFSLIKQPEISERFALLLQKSLWESANMWQNQICFFEWCKNYDKYFFKKYPNDILRVSNQKRKMLKEIQEDLASSTENWPKLEKIPDFKETIDRLTNLIEKDLPVLEKIYFIYYLLENPAIMGLRDKLLTDLNYLYKDINQEKLKDLALNCFLNNTFTLFDCLKETNIEKILECLLSLGQSIYRSEDQNSIDLFIEYLLRFGFIYPGEMKVNDDWQIQSNKNHLKIVRLWLEFITLSPQYSYKLIAALIVNIKTGGILIRDEDLFQRDISSILNSNIKPNYVLIKQLLSHFPIYYSGIGAEGEIREVSTNIDKISCSEDKLIHFLRKQIHSESNNLQIELIKSIFYYWYDGNIQHLQRFLPPDVKKELPVSGEWFEPVHSLTKQLVNIMKKNPTALLEEDSGNIKAALAAIDCDYVNNTNCNRIIHLIELYQLLKHKYTLDHKFIYHDLQKSNIFTGKELQKLEKNIKKNKFESAIRQIYSMVSKLKSIILETPYSDVRESIYYKRHIASGIPSMYGQYSEQKFEAMGLILRLEKLTGFLINKLISERNLDYMTIDGFHSAARMLDLFKDGLELNGISNENFNSHLEMLNYSFKTTTFSMDQFVNIFSFITLNIKEIIDNYYIAPFSAPLKTIIAQNINKKEIHNKTSLEHLVYRKSEEFYREIIVSAFLVQSLDNYVSKILTTLKNMMGKLKPEVIHMLLNYNPKLLSTFLHKPNAKVDNQIFLGAKAYYLKKLYSYKFPIPAGFVLTTEWFRDRKAFIQFPEMYQAIIARIKDKLSELEKITKKKLGDPNNPLLLSVRSGTVIPMPGAMDSILNIGMNDEIAEGLSKVRGYGWAAWDSYRRLLQNWGMANGIERDEFDKLILKYKGIYQIKEKREFSKEQMKTIAFSYKELLLNYGVKLEEDPFSQLIQAIMFVFQSWYNDRAQIFRKKLQIAEEWGTAVIVQEMILGNINTKSGSGVLFTKIPFEKSSEVTLYGDFTSCSQGEDIVSGLVYTLPISEFQNEKFPHVRGESLEVRFPEIYQRLLALAKELIYERGYEHQEIEFTFKSKRKKDLYILQTRPYVLKDKEKTPIFTSPDILNYLVGTGIGIGRGAMNGRIAFNLTDIRMLAENYPDDHKILIRPDTVPDDIEMIFECDGLLTSRGGVTSHAAVTAAQLGKICVVNCKHLSVFEKEKKCVINDNVFRSGDRIAIDAYLGNIYKGHHAIDLEQISYFKERRKL